MTVVEPTPRALAYPFAAPAPDGSVVEVAPGVLWARMPMPIALDHVNVWLLRGDAGWTVVDTGLATQATRECWERIAAEHLGGAPIVSLVCTHFHYDHAGLAAWFDERFGARLHMTRSEYLTMHVLGPLPDPPPAAMLRFHARAGMPDERAQRVFAALRSDPFMAAAPSHFERLRGGDELVIGPRRWQVLIGEGHSPEHACLYCADEGLLIAGDQLLPRISSNVLVNAIEPEANPLALWFDSLDRLDRCRPDTLVLPSHQEAFRGLHVRVQELRAHHQRQFDALRAFIARQGEASAYEAMLALFPRLKHPADEMLALGETVAHLAWLRESGSLSRRLDETGVQRWSVVDAPQDLEVHQ